MIYGGLCPTKVSEWRFKKDVYYELQAHYSIFLMGFNTIRELKNLKCLNIPWIYTSNFLTK